MFSVQAAAGGRSLTPHMFHSFDSGGGAEAECRLLAPVNTFLYSVCLAALRTKTTKPLWPIQLRLPFILFVVSDKLFRFIGANLKHGGRVFPLKPLGGSLINNMPFCLFQQQTQHVLTPFLIGRHAAIISFLHQFPQNSWRKKLGNDVVHLQCFYFEGGCLYFFN